jgi:PIN domain nuclease of toxin-antitoxin system
MKSGKQSVPDRVLLDTHALVWLAFADRSLGVSSRTLIDNALNDYAVFVSAISFFEIATLRRRSRLLLYAETDDWRREVLQNGVLEAPVTGEISVLAGSLDGLPGDPADRIITATAIAQGFTLVTADQRILTWSGNLRCQDARG